MTISLFRIQDRNGRGPFQPGFSQRWADETGGSRLPPFFEEFDGIVPRMHKKLGMSGGACGCAVRTLAEIVLWFTPTEQARLASLGFHIVKIDVDQIMAESANQVVFWRATPLRFCVERISFPEAA